MDKYEFVRQLNAFLKGKVSHEELNDTIAYYEDYIDTEIKKGRSEEEVVESLGSPRLLAKTIADTRKMEEAQGVYRQEEDWEQTEADRRHRVGFPSWLKAILFFLIVICIFAVVFKMIVLLAPVLAVAFFVIFLYRLFTGADR